MKSSDGGTNYYGLHRLCQDDNYLAAINLEMLII